MSKPSCHFELFITSVLFKIYAPNLHYQLVVDIRDFLIHVDDDGHGVGMPK